MPEKIKIEGQTIALSPPEEIPPKRTFYGREKELRLCRAAWRVTSDGKTLEEDDSLRLYFRLQGPPGVGKNEIVYQIARELELPLYIIQGHDELSPEDLSLLLVPDPKRSGSGDIPLALRASPLATALYKGGLFFFDEINRVPEKSLAPLASVLDDRMHIFSAMTGLRIGPKTDRERKRFRFCCALNPTVTEAGIGALPDYIEQRTLPVIDVDYPDFKDLQKIIELSLTPPAEFIAAFGEWCNEQPQHKISVRQALSLMRYALTSALQNGIKQPLEAIRKVAPMFVNRPSSSSAKKGK